MPLEPLSAADRLRAERKSGVQLYTDRVIKTQTRSRRLDLLSKFGAWLQTNKGLSISGLLDATVVDAEMISRLLVEYGRELYYSGRPYGIYSETINAVASHRGSLRRQLGLAWDLAFSWVADEPASHHPAMPKSVLLAISSLALLWGWPIEAGIFLLTWSGILRIGEVLNSYRRDLVLPQDSDPGATSVLLRITTPKTRGRAARHQSARVDFSDIVEYLSVVFGAFRPDQPLWPMSSATLRKRLNMLLTALGMPTSRSHESQPYDMGSFRPGGPTYLLNLLEDSELVRRRGRWISTRVLEIYWQEVPTATRNTRLTEISRSRIDRLSVQFPAIRLKAQEFIKSDISPLAWRHLF